MKKTRTPTNSDQTDVHGILYSVASAHVIISDLSLFIDNSDTSPVPDFGEYLFPYIVNGNPNCIYDVGRRVQISFVKSNNPADGNA